MRAIEREREREGWLSSVLNNTLEPSVCACSESQAIYSSLTLAFPTRSNISMLCLLAPWTALFPQHSLRLSITRSHRTFSPVSTRQHLGQIQSHSKTHCICFLALFRRRTPLALSVQTHTPLFSPDCTLVQTRWRT